MDLLAPEIMKEILAEKIMSLLKGFQKNREKLTEEKMDLFFDEKGDFLSKKI